MRERERIIDFLQALEDKTTAHRESFKWGTVFSHPRFHRVWDLNYLRVEGAPDVRAEELVGEAERVQSAAGLAHRKVVINDDELGSRLAPEFRGIGWQVAPLLMMAHHRPPDRRPEQSADELSLAEAKLVRERFLRQDPSIAKDEISVEQLRDQAEVVVDAVRARFFGARVDGRVASMCELYSDGSTAQIEAVITLEEHRGLGLARAVVLRALDEANRAGHGFVFLLADDDDWPKHLYTKLGFDEVGRGYDFTLPPSKTESPSAAGPG